jgi:NAD(P)-dependent dehydrogenase (short-subunit alcohol dehydrogenase family)
MDLKLNDRLAVITGSTEGIGKAIAATLAAEGARVVINGRSQEKADRVAAELAEAGEVHGIGADLGSAEGVARLIGGSREIGPIDILINNFGIFEPKPFAEISDEDWQRFFNLNVLSAIRCARSVMGEMRRRGWGRILFISSESGINIPVEMVQYGMTKTALLAISRGLAKTLAATGVTVNALLPGPTWTAGVAEFIEKLAAERGLSIEECKAEFFRNARPSSLLRRFADPQEIANHAVYLCSPLADAATGAAHRVDGGVVDTCF